MIRFMLTAAALALFSTGAHAEKASVGIPLYAGGFWKTTYYARNTNGNPMCSLSGNWKFANGVTGAANLKWASNFGLFMHISKSNWSFASGVKVTAMIELGSVSRTGTGRTTIGHNSQSIIEVRVQQAHAIKFVEDFAAADKMVITFKDGNEPPWVGKTAGARAAAVAFMKCVAKVGGTDMTSPIPQAEATSPVPQEPGMTPVVPETPTSKPEFGAPTASQPFANGKGGI